jgi:hypothetical protein
MQFSPTLKWCHHNISNPILKLRHHPQIIVLIVPIREVPTHFSLRLLTYYNKHESALINHSLNIKQFILIFLHGIRLPNVCVINLIEHKLACGFCIHTLISLIFEALHH